jgi:hypothetical protein
MSPIPAETKLSTHSGKKSKWRKVIPGLKSKPKSQSKGPQISSPPELPNSPRPGKFPPPAEREAEENQGVHISRPGEMAIQEIQIPPLERTSEAGILPPPIPKKSLLETENPSLLRSEVDEAKLGVANYERQTPISPSIETHKRPSVREGNHVHHGKISYGDSNGMLAGALAGGVIVAAFLGLESFYNWLARRQERRSASSSSRKYSTQDEE